MPPEEPFSLLEDKLQFLRESIHEFEEQIRQREQHRQTFLDEILQKTCDVQNIIGATDDHLPRKTTFELEIHHLEKEMRQQKLECWRDVTGLQRELRQLTREYRALRGALCSMQKK